MNITLSRGTLFLALSSSTLLFAAGQELDLLAARLDVKASPMHVGGFPETSEATHLSAFCLRYGYDLAIFGKTCLQLQATYQFQGQATIAPVSSPNYFFGAPYTYKMDAYAVGMQAQWHYGAQFGIGPELRWERFEDGGISCSQVRPWLTTRLGWTLPSSSLTYLVGMEGAWALANSRKSGIWTVDNNGMTVFGQTAGSNLRSFAPSTGFSLFIGVRL